MSPDTRQDVNPGPDTKNQGQLDVARKVIRKRDSLLRVLAK